MTGAGQRDEGRRARKAGKGGEAVAVAVRRSPAVPITAPLKSVSPDFGVLRLIGIDNSRFREVAMAGVTSRQNGDALAAFANPTNDGRYWRKTS
jgi:hypothetical protein